MIQCDKCNSTGMYHQVLNSTTYHRFKSRKCHSELITGEECVARSIQSHSLGRSAFLAEIAQNGHVLSIKSTHEGYEIDVISIGEATTFPGFCRNHDNNLFASIDGITKEQTAKQLDLWAIRGTVFSIMYAQSFLARGEQLLKLRLCATCIVEINFEYQLIERTHQCLRDYVKRVSANLGKESQLRETYDFDFASFACCYTTIIGNSTEFIPFKIQDNITLCISAYPMGNKTRVALVGTRSEASTSFFENFNLLSVDKKKRILSNLILQYCHNYFLKPTISDASKERILSKYKLRRADRTTNIDLWRL